MKRTFIVSVTIAMCLGYAAFASAQIPCVLTSFSQLPANTGLFLGPTVYNLALQVPELGPVIAAARDAWNMTHATGRLGGYAGYTGSDCPAGQPHYQIGAFDFRATPSCATVASYNQLYPYNSYTDVIAFVDYYSPATMLNVGGVYCPHCGTKSMMLNLRYTFSFNPQAMQYDVQGIMAHEFGHMLGLWHMTGANCGDGFDPPHCAQDPNRNTMGKFIYDGETCERDLSFNYDIVNANSVY